MRYWLTTHWPRRVDEATDTPQGGVWVPDRKQHVIDRVAPGDLVFIYESTGGRVEIRTYLDGTTRRIPTRRGRGGLVALAQVTEPAYELEDTQPEKYTDGSSVWWRYFAPTESVNSAGFIPRPQLATLLGYSSKYVFRGFGESRSGLKELSPQLFQTLFDAFTEHAELTEQQRTVAASRMPGRAGGEGPEHLALKKRIASDPAAILGEEGLRLWSEEWSLATGDRIDLVLKDRFDRFVAVEVEVDCAETEIAGPLQCMKYRAMLSYMFDRPLAEVRAILAAHSVNSAVLERSRSHGIQTVIVRRL